jgi:hypothetical protein
MTMRNCLAMALLAVAGLLLSSAEALGQGFNSTGTSGLFNSTRSVGSGITAGTRTAVSGSVAGMTTGGNTGQDAPMGIGQIGSSDRFVRENRDPAAFVGATAADVQEFVGAVQSGTGADFRTQNLGGGMRRGTNVNQPGAGGGRGSRVTTIRTTLNVAFDHPTLPATTVSRALSDRLVRLGRIRPLAGLQVEVQDGTATLRGVVASQRDRDVAEQLARLEAGIWKVKNELQVAQITPEMGPAVPAPNSAVPSESPEDSAEGPPAVELPPRPPAP